MPGKREQSQARRLGSVLFYAQTAQILCKPKRGAAGMGDRMAMATVN
ncbi:hypothetical protein C7445_1319 [Alicyclobacillus sacchari]|uniref:Uncharacterized protein n=1 Tax=Alicyclobacillus sacchari TaxID=392010 RepID=A0A4R8L7Z2_9BACL|nr:hypothetical protein C7445_1319 [Alicyclobacillus sacchari]